MRISELLQSDTPKLSFEVFPPKTSDNMESVLEATQEIAKLHPDFMSVTYGAGGGTSKFTLDIAREISDNYGVPSIAHLTCVSSTKETVRKQLSRIKDAGIENILALRGDIPAEPVESDFEHAVELINEINEYDDFCIGGACYPETHPESENQKEDIMHLKEKVDAGLDFLTTQMFFDNNIFYNFLYKVREAGIEIPIVPGIMPVTRASQIKRIIGLSGTQLPQRFKQIVDRFGNDPMAMQQAGIIYASAQIIDLYANGINLVHVYSMNKPEVAEGIKRNLSAILGE